MKKLLTYSLVVATIVWSVGLIAMPLGVSAVSSGSLIKKADSPAVYYLGADGKRYAFPRAEIYMTWYSNYSGVEVVSNEVFNSYMYGGSVFPKPGVKLVQFVDGETPWHVLDPKVYAVAGDGVLRHITTADAAVSIFGSNWETMIIPIIELLASEYTFGDDIVVAGDFDKVAETEAASTINDNQNLGGSVSGGTSLTVALAADTPASGIVVGGAARVAFTKVNLTASADGDITIDNWVVERAGLGNDAAFSSIDIVDASTMMPINTTGKTFTSLHTANFTEDFTIPAGTTKSVYLAGNMASSLASYAGEVPALSLKSVALKGSGAVIGSLPVTGNYQNLNGTITIGTATVSRGAYSNATSSSLEVGKTNYTFFSFQIVAGSTEDVTFSQVKVYQSGSASLSDDLANIKLYQDGTELATGVVSGNYVTFNVSPITLLKGQTKQFLVKADVVSGSARTVKLAIYKSTDLLVKGLTYGYNITPTYSGTGSGSDTNVLTDNQATISTGTLRIGRSSTVGAENITVGSDQVLGAFEFEAKGEPAIISALTLTITSSTSGTIVEDALQGVKLVDENGIAVAGPTDIANNTLTVAFTDTFTVPVGLHHYKVVGNVYTSGGWTTNDTIYASVTPSAVTTKGETTGLTITPTPNSAVTTATQTIKAANLTVSKNSTPTNKTVITNSTGVLIGSWTFDASNSGENIRITTIALKASSTAKLNTLTLKDGTTALSPVNDALSAATTKLVPNTSTFALSEPLIVTKGTSKTINLYANIASNALAGEVDAWGITSNAAITAYGVTTGNSATATVTANDGAQITIAAAGTIQFLEHGDALSARLVVDGSTAQNLTDMLVKATNEDVDITSMTVYVEDGGLTGTGVGSYTQLSKIYIKLDGTIVGNADGYNIASASKLLNFERGQVTIPKGDTGKKLSILGDIVQIGTGEPGTENVDIKVGISDPATTVGTGSNASAARTYTDASGSAVIIHEAVPQVSIASTASSFGGSLSAGRLHKTSITAVGGPIGIWRMSYEITTTTANLNVNSAFLKCMSGCSGINNETQLSATSDGADTGIINNAAKENFFLEVDSAFAGKQYVQIAENATAIIELYGNVSGQSTTEIDSAVVRLLGDQATTTADNLAGNAANTNVWGETDQVHNNFVWSSLHLDSSQAATSLTEKQWFNGYLVTGMGTSVSTTPVSIPE